MRVQSVEVVVKTCDVQCVHNQSVLIGSYHGFPLSVEVPARPTLQSADSTESFSRKL